MTETYDYIFYTFICNDPNITDNYVGSTKAFRQRKSTHKCHCNNENSNKYNFKLYQSIRANGGWDNWEMKPIETKNCSTLEAHIFETKLMDERNTTLNIYKAYTSEEQYKLNKIEYHLKNKEKNNKQSLDNYYANKEKRNKQSLEYYHANKDKIKAQQKERYLKRKADQDAL